MSRTYTPGPWRLNSQYADIEIRGPAESCVLIAVMSPWGVVMTPVRPSEPSRRVPTEYEWSGRRCRPVELVSAVSGGVTARSSQFEQPELK